MAVSGLLSGLLGCASGKYDKDLRLYLASGATEAVGKADSSAWYVVGARLPGRRFQELGFRFPAEPGEPLVLQREGDVIFASAAGIRAPIEEVPPETIYLAWARENRRPPPHGGGSGGGGGFIDVEFDLFGSLLDSLFDDDDDDDARPERRDKKSKERDRGERYARPKADDSRKRTRD